jgi:hypothetical protein
MPGVRVGADAAGESDAGADADAEAEEGMTHAERIAELEAMVDALVKAYRIQAEINRVQATMNQLVAAKLDPPEWPQASQVKH